MWEESEFEQGDEVIRDRIGRALRKCCKEHGFFAISVHGVSNRIKEDAVDITRKFLNFP